MLPLLLGLFEKVSEEMYMEEQFGLPEGLSVMDVITRCKQGQKKGNPKASKVPLGNLFNDSLSSTRGTYQEQKIE